jgi:hypothetical protein
MKAKACQVYVQINEIPVWVRQIITRKIYDISAI